MANAEEKLLKLKALKELGQKVYDDYATKKEVTTLTEKVTTLEDNVPKKVSDLDNDKNFQTGDDVDGKIKAQIGSVYKPAGSVAFESLPTPGEDNVGNVYNVTDKFTTDEKFVEDEGKEYPAGTNVVVVSVSEEYKFDVLSGFVDLTSYATTAQMNASLAEKLGKEESAASAKKLDTTTAGEAIKPVYFADGVPVECAHKLEKDVPADAKFTDTTYEDASSMEAGLMSTKDKEKLDGMEIASDEEVTSMITQIFSPAE